MGGKEFTTSKETSSEKELLSCSEGQQSANGAASKGRKRGDEGSNHRIGGVWLGGRLKSSRTVPQF